MLSSLKAKGKEIVTKIYSIVNLVLVIVLLVTYNEKKKKKIS